ncbi:disease resistance protein RPV1 [Eucalyptus grandis]|uniref:disease resistance protein RPV1 n=1 Tax=Eucalyptus grandis TaxID=71139 RepID=UPI00192EA51F|nr:disease resistance protein RPV1 [Eucalyptus grandis]
MSGQPLYEVFLSFRRQGMRNHFVDFLYTMLTDVGIHVFRDEEEPEKGGEILPQLIRAIEQSKISIPVISIEYGSSNICLMELVQMVECMDRKNHTIIPIFYHVNPLDAFNCRGTFQTADEHQKRALRQVGALAKYHHVERSDLCHSNVIKQIVLQVERMLKKKDLIVPKQLVGVNPHMQEIMAKLKVDYRNGQAIKIGDTCEKMLIYGIPGVGKTVLAKCVYNELNHLYDACGFLENIQAEISDHGIVSVQNRLISHLQKGNASNFNRSDVALTYFQRRFLTMKVLVLLDDVKDHEQLSALVGKLDWLGPRSVVILTSQTHDVLKNISGAEGYVLEPMKQDEALKLFCRHAFGTDCPREEFKTLSTDIVAATGRLPLALEVTGSSLFLVESKKVWRETRIALEVSPPKRVQVALKKSYADLDRNAQGIFLDIACFFTGMDKRISYYMWNDCKYNPSKTIPALLARSLVKIGEDKQVLMHEILKKFGQEIVKNENQNEPCKRSRLWNHEEALHVLRRGEGTKNVEALGLEFGDRSERDVSFECDHFDGLQNLRFLKLDQANIRGNFGDCLSSLRWLDWQGCPKTFDVKTLNLNLQNLLILDLSGSQVDEDWKGWELLVVARRLKVLKLTGCDQLIATPKFPASMELERLILEGCSNLAVVHPSFRNLKKLVSVNMKGCSQLCELPDCGPTRALKEVLIDGTSISRIDVQEGFMKELEFLSACNCKRLTEISNSIRYLKSLRYLCLDDSKIHTLWESIGSLEKLKTLSLKNCRRLSNLPDEIGKLRSLRFLDLSDTVIQELPPSVKDLKAMKVLRMRCTLIREFPEAILNLEKLKEIDFSVCQSLEGEIPFNIWRLSSLQILKLSDTRISGLPPSISRLSFLRELHISRCDNLQSLPELPCFVNVLRDLGN